MAEAQFKPVLNDILLSYNIPVRQMPMLIGAINSNRQAIFKLRLPMYILALRASETLPLKMVSYH